MHFFKKSILALALCAAGAANATVVNFNTAADGAYFAPSVTSNGFTVTSDMQMDSDIGTMSNIDGRGVTNGTVYLGLWTNTYAAATFMLTSAVNAAFSLQSFDFNNAYPVDSGRASSVTVVGTLANQTTVTQTFANLANITSFQTYLLNSSFQNLTSVAFTATGNDVRALFDNIVVNAPAAAIPEPGSLALLGLGIMGLAASRKKKQG